MRGSQLLRHVRRRFARGLDPALRRRLEGGVDSEAVQTAGKLTANERTRLEDVLESLAVAS